MSEVRKWTTAGHCHHSHMSRLRVVQRAAELERNVYISFGIRGLRWFKQGAYLAYWYTADPPGPRGCASRRPVDAPNCGWHQTLYTWRSSHADVPLPLTEALPGFSLANLRRQHPCSCALMSLLRKVSPELSEKRI